VEMMRRTTSDGSFGPLKIQILNKSSFPHDCFMLHSPYLMVHAEIR
jgi:hypothetical protein